MVAGKREIKYWVLGWGSNACVLEPEALREEVLAKARAMAGLYEAGDEFSSSVSRYEAKQAEPRRPKAGS